MTTGAELSLLRIHLSNLTGWKGQPLYEALVEKARRDHLPGATVLAGIAGFVGAGPLLDAHPLALQVERPIILEMIGPAEDLEGFLERSADMLSVGPVLVTLERAVVRRYGENGMELGAEG